MTIFSSLTLLFNLFPKIPKVPNKVKGRDYMKKSAVSNLHQQA